MLLFFAAAVYVVVDAPTVIHLLQFVNLIVFVVDSANFIVVIIIFAIISVVVVAVHVVIASVYVDATNLDTVTVLVLPFVGDVVVFAAAVYVVVDAPTVIHLLQFVNDIVVVVDVTIVVVDGL